MNFTRVETPLRVESGRYRKIDGQPSQVASWAPQYIVDIHRPETWGYVQFEHARRAFVPDPAWPARRWLQAVYYAERDFRKSSGRWTDRLADLGLTPPADGPIETKIETTGELFEVSVTLPRGGAPAERWHISQDGRIWK
jgi:hypothetical protein